MSTKTKLEYCFAMKNEHSEQTFFLNSYKKELSSWCWCETSVSRKQFSSRDNFKTVVFHIIACSEGTRMALFNWQPIIYLNFMQWESLVCQKFGSFEVLSVFIVSLAMPSISLIMVNRSCVYYKITSALI